MTAALLLPAAAGAQACAHWSAGFIGIPWRKDGEGPAAYDCKGLVRHVQRQHYDREVPRLLGINPLTDWAAVRESAERDGWGRVTFDARHPAQDGDILVVHDGLGAHVGVVLQLRAASPLRWVLHARGSVERGGAVRCDELRDVLASYGRPQLWRHHGQPAA